MKPAKAITALAVASTLIFGLTACTDDQWQGPDYARICVDPVTQLRVPGWRCGTNDLHPLDGLAWYYIPYGHILPAYNRPATTGRYSVKLSAVVAHDETLASTGGKTYIKAKTVPYSTASGKKLGISSGSGYKAPAVKAPKVNAPANKPAAPAYKPPAPVYKAPPKIGK